jgi:hypothetical protein
VLNQEISGVLTAFSSASSASSAWTYSDATIKFKNGSSSVISSRLGPYNKSYLLVFRFDFSEALVDYAFF